MDLRSAQIRTVYVGNMTKLSIQEIIELDQGSPTTRRALQCIGERGEVIDSLEEKVDYLLVELDFRKAQLDDERNENSIFKDRIKEALEWIDMHGDYRTAASVLRGDA